MKDFILIWTNMDYPEMDGGVKFEQYENISELEERVNKLQQEYKERFELNYVAEIKDVIEFKPVEKIVRWEADR